MSEVNKLSVKITGDESGLKRATREAKKDIAEVADSAISMGKIIGGAALGSFLGGAISAIISNLGRMADSTKQAFDDASASMTKLATVMTQRGATQQQYNEILALTNAEEKLGVVSATAMQNGLQELATYVGKAESLKKLTNTMNNLIVQQHGYNASAEQALQTATMMGKVLQGQTGGMERIGYHLDEADKALFNYGTEEERVALLTSIVNENLGDMNHALGQTDTGKHIQLANTWAQLRAQIGELARAVGNILIPVFSAVANAVGRAIAYIKAFLKLFGIQTGNSANGTAAAVTGAADAVGDYGDAASGAAKKAKKALAAFDEMNVLTEQTDSGSGSGGGGGVDILGDLEASAEAINWDSLIPDIDLPDWINKIRNLFSDIDFSKLQASMEKFWSSLKKAIKGVLKIGEKMIENFIAPMVKYAAENTLPQIFNAVADALDSIDFGKIAEAAGHVMGAFARIGTVVMDVVGGVIEAAAPIISWLANFVVPPALEAIGVVLNTIGAVIGGIWDAVSAFYESAIKPLLDAIGGMLEPVLNFLNETFGALNENGEAWEGLRGIISGVAEFLLNILKPAFDVITWLIQNVVTPVVQGLIEVVKTVFGWLGDLLGAIFGIEKEEENLSQKVSENTKQWDDNADGILSAAEAMQHWDDVVMQVNNAELKLMNSQEELRKKTAALDEYVQAYGKTQEELTKLYHDNKLETLGLSDDALVKLKRAIIEAENAEIKMRAAQDEKRKADVAEQEMISAMWQEYNDLGRKLVDVAKQHGINSEEYNKAKDAMDEARQKAESYGEANMSIIDWTRAAAAAVEEMGNKTINAAGRMKGAADVLGGDIGDGFIGGLDRKNGALYYAGVRAGRTVIQGARDGADTHSPSKAAMEIGGWVDEGLAIGLKDNQDLVEKTATGIGNALVSAIDTAPKFRDLGTIEIADQFSELTARAQGTMELQSESTNDAIDQLAGAITNLADKDQRVIVQIGEETLYDKIINGINEASRMRNQTVINL